MNWIKKIDLKLIQSIKKNIFFVQPYCQLHYAWKIILLINEESSEMLAFNLVNEMSSIDYGDEVDMKNNLHNTNKV